MQTTPDEAALFREECLYWQREFGLTDWTLQFKIEGPNEDGDEADVYYDCDTRHAMVTYYMGTKDALHPSDVACHEMMHLLFADMTLAGVEARDEQDNVLAREEHKVIERLLKVLAKKRKKH
jgi:hypothetical protein